MPATWISCASCWRPIGRAPMPSCGAAGTIASGRIRCTTFSDAIFEGILGRAKAVPLVDALLAAGSNVDFHEPGKGETPLHWAANRGLHRLARRLIEAGAQVKGEWLESKEIQARPEVLAALRSG